MTPLEKLIDVEEDSRRYGFTWPHWQMVMDQVLDECREVREELEEGASRDKLQEELGDLLHSVISLCIFTGFSIDETLDKTQEKFARRMGLLKEVALEKGFQTLQGQETPLLVSLWKEVKRREATSAASE